MDRSTDKSEFKIKEDNMTMVWQMYQLIPSRDIDDQRILESDGPELHNWLHPIKSGSLRCYLPMMTNSTHIKLRYQLIFKDIVGK